MISASLRSVVVAARRFCGLDVCSDRVEVPAGPRVEAEDLPAGGGQRERDALPRAVGPVREEVADERERPHHEVALELAEVALHGGEVLVGAQADLGEAAARPAPQVGPLLAVVEHGHGVHGGAVADSHLHDAVHAAHVHVADVPAAAARPPPAPAAAACRRSHGVLECWLGRNRVSIRICGAPPKSTAGRWHRCVVVQYVLGTTTAVLHRSRRVAAVCLIFFVGQQVMPSAGQAVLLCTQNLRASPIDLM
jgi:hypothetical protein